jgi:hypothetical protein
VFFLCKTQKLFSVYLIFLALCLEVLSFVLVGQLVLYGGVLEERVAVGVDLRLLADELAAKGATTMRR